MPKHMLMGPVSKAWVVWVFQRAVKSDQAIVRALESRPNRWGHKYDSKSRRHSRSYSLSCCFYLDCKITNVRDLGVAGANPATRSLTPRFVQTALRGVSAPPRRRVLIARVRDPVSCKAPAPAPAPLVHRGLLVDAISMRMQSLLEGLTKQAVRPAPCVSGLADK